MTVVNKQLPIFVLIYFTQFSCQYGESKNFLLLRITSSVVGHDYNGTPFAKEKMLSKGYRMHGMNSWPGYVSEKEVKNNDGYRFQTKTGETECTGTCIQGICYSESEAKQENCDTDEDCKNICVGNFSSVRSIQKGLKENKIDDDFTNLTPFSTTICKNGVCTKSNSTKIHRRLISHDSLELSDNSNQSIALHNPGFEPPPLNKLSSVSNTGSHSSFSCTNGQCVSKTCFNGECNTTAINSTMNMPSHNSFNTGHMSASGNQQLNTQVALNANDAKTVVSSSSNLMIQQSPPKHLSIPGHSQASIIRSHGNIPGTSSSKVCKDGYCETKTCKNGVCKTVAINSMKHMSHYSPLPVVKGTNDPKSIIHKIAHGAHPIPAVKGSVDSKLVHHKIGHGNHPIPAIKGQHGAHLAHHKIPLGVHPIPAVKNGLESKLTHHQITHGAHPIPAVKGAIGTKLAHNKVIHGAHPNLGKIGINQKTLTPSQKFNIQKYSSMAQPANSPIELKIKSSNINPAVEPIGNRVPLQQSGASMFQLNGIKPALSNPGAIHSPIHPQRVGRAVHTFSHHIHPGSSQTHLSNAAMIRPGIAQVIPAHLRQSAGASNSLVNKMKSGAKSHVGSNGGINFMAKKLKSHQISPALHSSSSTSHSCKNGNCVSTTCTKGNCNQHKANQSQLKMGGSWTQGLNKSVTSNLEEHHNPKMKIHKTTHHESSANLVDGGGISLFDEKSNFNPPPGSSGQSHKSASSYSCKNGKCVSKTCNNGKCNIETINSMQNVEKEIGAQKSNGIAQIVSAANQSSYPLSSSTHNSGIMMPSGQSHASSSSYSCKNGKCISKTCKNGNCNTDTSDSMLQIEKQIAPHESNMQTKKISSTNQASNGLDSIPSPPASNNSGLSSDSKKSKKV